ncbi:dTDP-4-dehydrorhamnose reductase [Devosia sp. UYZn731]|uniref:dTDP-4-dehydrorhamnose reductase family protein n=1 Tax=Devosia sp. UYZn731 TaxID=3156345 RepID=UPI003397CC9F
MRVLILGGDGMLGHRLLLELSPRHEVVCTLRRDLAEYHQFGIFNDQNSLTGIDARDTERLIEAIGTVRADVVVNAIGIVKQQPTSSDVLQSLEINAVLPHRLAAACQQSGARLIHISTDCVFAGDRGAYSEDDVADAIDTYGRTKHLGEVGGNNCVTLRTSMIGLELHRKRSLVEWYLAQRGTIRGFSRAIYSGLTTPELGRVIDMLITRFPDLSGVYQVVSEPISKFDLLSDLNTLLNRQDLVIAREEVFFCDRSMKGDKFRAATGYQAPAWDVMLEELATAIRQR